MFHINFYIKVDVSKLEQIQSLKDCLLKDFAKSVDILINNAGVMDMMSFTDKDVAPGFRKSIEVNLMAQMWVRPVK